MNKQLENKINNLINKTKATYLSEKLTYQGKFIEIITEKYLLPNNKIIEKERIKKIITKKQ